MHIAFGYQLDGVSWSDRESALGVVRTGPEGLLSLLETRCGVTSKPVDQTARVAEMYTLLAGMDTDDAWFHDSFDADLWATAQELLTVANELREARLAHQTCSNAAAGEIPGGAPERIAQLLEELRLPADRRLAQVSDLQISVDLPYDYLTPIWKAIFDALTRCGAAVSYADEETHNETDTQVTLLRTEDEWEAADYVAARLSLVHSSALFSSHRPKWRSRTP